VITVYQQRHIAEVGRSGTFTIDGGPSGVTFHNYGTVDDQSGTIDFHSGYVWLHDTSLVESVHGICGFIYVHEFEYANIG